MGGAVALTSGSRGRVLAGPPVAVCLGDRMLAWSSEESMVRGVEASPVWGCRFPLSARVSFP